jgi:NADH-quinone oxidoreductase subunit N
MTLRTPILWVLLPLVVGGVTIIFNKKRGVGVLLPSITALGLAALAIFFPEDLRLVLGPLTIRFIENLNILGRQITVSTEILPFIALLFGATGLWTLSTGFNSTPQLMQPISLAMTALLTAALGIQPFLYAALLIQAVVLISIPMLSSGTHAPHRGILRYLSLQTIAMPFILFAGWLLSGVETLPPESTLIGQSVLLLGIGFALLLAIFPFHTWVPMVSEVASPAAISFLLFVMPTTILIFGLNFFNRYPFLRSLENLAVTLRLLGSLMILVGGMWTAFQDNLKRAFGFSSLTETGFSLLALSLIAQDGLYWLLMLMPTRALGFWLWGYTLARIKTHVPSLETRSIQGFARRYPILSIGLIFAQFSIAGMPLLAAFPIKLTILANLRGTEMAFFALSFIGNLGLFLFTLRVMNSFLTPNKEIASQQWSFTEPAREYLPILVAILFLILMGMLPARLLTWITDTLTAFPQLQ